MDLEGGPYVSPTRPKGKGMPARIHLNPKLPVDFIGTPITERSKEQLDEWWGKPYAFSNQTEPSRCTV